jgi:hypothetical protein
MPEPPTAVPGNRKHEDQLGEAEHDSQRREQRIIGTAGLPIFKKQSRGGTEEEDTSQALRRHGGRGELSVADHVREPVGKAEHPDAEEQGSGDDAQRQPVALVIAVRRPPPDKNESRSAGQAGDVAQEHKAVAGLGDGMKHFQDAHRQKADGGRLKSVVGRVIASKEQHGGHPD